MCLSPNQQQLAVSLCYRQYLHIHGSRKTEIEKKNGHSIYTHIPSWSPHIQSCPRETRALANNPLACILLPFSLTGKVTLPVKKKAITHNCSKCKLSRYLILCILASWRNRRYHYFATHKIENLHKKCNLIKLGVGECSLWVWSYSGVSGVSCLLNSCCRLCLQLM